MIDETGAVIPGPQNVEGIEHFQPELQEGKRYSIGKYEEIPVLTISMPVIWMNGKVVELQMIQLLNDVKQNLVTLILILAGVTLIAMIPITISSIALGRMVTQPIEKLITTMSRSRKTGTYEKISVPTEGQDEMTQMGRTFNDMMGQLEQNFNQQEQFVSNASHELKTPLTVIESYARLLTRRGFDDRAVRKRQLGQFLNRFG